MAGLINIVPSSKRINVKICRHVPIIAFNQTCTFMSISTMVSELHVFNIINLDNYLDILEY